MVNLENTKAQMRKGVLEFCTLSIIAKGQIYPSDIIAQLRSSQMMVVEGTLYPLLTRLKNAGLITYTWVESNAGPPRKYFTITDQGHAFLKELESTWHDLVSSVNNTIKHS
jgi:PadR family transcriptional regulator PadR